MLMVDFSAENKRQVDVGSNFQITDSDTCYSNLEEEILFLILSDSVSNDRSHERVCEVFF